MNRLVRTEPYVIFPFASIIAYNRVSLSGAGASEWKNMCFLFLLASLSATIPESIIFRDLFAQTKPRVSK